MKSEKFAVGGGKYPTGNKAGTPIAKAAGVADPLRNAKATSAAERPSVRKFDVRKERPAG